MRSEVAQDVHGAIQVRKRCHFTPDAIIQSAIRIVVNEAVSNPNTRHNALINFSNQLERLLDAFALINLARSERLGGRFQIVSQDEKARVADDRYHFTRFAPDHILHRHI